MTKIPLITPCFSDELLYLKKCLDSGHVTQGPMVAEFERVFSRYHKSCHALAVSSCTAALHASLLALGIGQGDEVIVPSFTWLATAHMVEMVGAKPVFADIRLSDYNIDPTQVEKLITSKTKAIIPVHLFGLMADMPSLLELSGDRGVAVIEDAACATGSKYKDHFAGTMGDVGCFSFHPRKVITTGEGGMLTTNSSQLAEKLHSIRNHGLSVPSEPLRPWQMAEVSTVGHNFRMSDIQGAVGLAQMGKIDSILEERKRVAHGYYERLKSCASIIVPEIKEEYSHSWQSYVVRFCKGIDERNKVASSMCDNEIQTRPGTYAVHATNYYRRKYGDANCPNALIAESSTLALPLYHGMSEKELDIVCDFFV